jgi:single-stranded-DNA-specific exonuclease
MAQHSGGFRPDSLTGAPGVAAQAPLDATTLLEQAAVPYALAAELPLDQLDAVPGRSRLLVQLLHNRGVSGAAAVETFLAAGWQASAPPLLGLPEAVARIRRAVAERERIVVYGDFDCDGVTSCALLTLVLRALGADAEAYVPRRDDDGRGLNTEAVRELAGRGAALIVTTDCGMANVEEVECARALGVEVIVTDHHPPHGPVAPALAVVNPRREDDPSPEKDLAGVGVAFRVAEALLAGSGAPAGTLDQVLDLVAIGTVADVVPLTQTNRALARAGLRRLNAAPRPGVRALLEAARLEPGYVSSRDISFALAPRLNTCGRMGEPRLALDILLTEDRAEAQRLAQRIEALNMERQQLTDVIVAAAREQASECLRTSGQPPVLVAQGRNWHLGVLGLVAGRLAEEYQRPVFVLSCGDFECRGSARGPLGVNLGEMLAARPDFFKRFGGHAQAAGFTIASGDREAFLSYIRAHFAEAARHQPLPPAGAGAAEGERRVRVDCRLPLARVRPGSDVYDDLELLEPFGAGFAEPTFLCPDVRILSCRRTGFERRTLRVMLEHKGVKREGVWSRHGDLCEQLQALPGPLPPVDVVFSLRKHHHAAGPDPSWLLHIETLTPSRS